MSIVAESVDRVVGVDTHARRHEFAVIDAATARVLDRRQFPTTPAGIGRAIAWIRRRAGSARFLVAVEGSASYGATLTRALLRDGIDVVEVRPPSRASRARHGKTDALDAPAAARGILSADLDQLGQPRQGELRDALNALTTARRQMSLEQTAARNQLTALLRTSGLADARTAPTPARIREIAAWREHPTDTLAQALQRREAVRLARRITALRADLDANERDLDQLVRAAAPELLEIHGVGPVSAAVILQAWSHPGRVRSDAAFARLAGAAPIRMQSGATDYHRLDRGGDRHLNSALFRIAHTRLTVPRQVVGRISGSGKLGVVGLARPRWTSDGRFQASAWCGRTVLNPAAGLRRRLQRGLAVGGRPALAG